MIIRFLRYIKNSWYLHRYLQALIIPLMTILFMSCQSIHELHYFKDRAGNPPNYYRLTIKGHAFLTSSRYLSGYFDEEAVNNYFGEITQPKNAKFDSVKIVPVDASQIGKKYVLLLSTNSDAISSAFGNFVESKQTQNELAKILNRDKLDELETVKANKSLADRKQDKLVTLGNSLLSSLTRQRPTRNFRSIYLPT